jgi:hypothetical protein
MSKGAIIGITIIIRNENKMNKRRKRREYVKELRLATPRRMIPVVTLGLYSDM